MSLCDTRVLCEVCGERLVGWAEKMNHMGRCTGPRDPAKWIAVVAMIAMGEANRATFVA